YGTPRPAPRWCNARAACARWPSIHLALGSLPGPRTGGRLRRVGIDLEIDVLVERLLLLRHVDRQLRIALRIAPLVGGDRREARLVAVGQRAQLVRAPRDRREVHAAVREPDEQPDLGARRRRLDVDRPLSRAEPGLPGEVGRQRG